MQTHSVTELDVVKGNKASVLVLFFVWYVCVEQLVALNILIFVVLECLFCYPVLVVGSVRQGE